MDAEILLFSLPVFHRAAVGEGRAALREHADSEAKHSRLSFAAASISARAHGLNRLGWIEEQVTERNATPVEAAYFGVMTSSPEQSVADAHKALDRRPEHAALYSAIHGRNTTGHSRSTVAHFEYPEISSIEDRGLIDHAQAALRSAKTPAKETEWPATGGAAPPTFLYTLARVLRSRAASARSAYVYNERRYTLEVETARDNSEQAHFAGRNVLPAGAGIVTVKARASETATGHTTRFRLWLADAPDALLPLRIELQPRAYLRLRLEAEPDKL